MKRRRECLNCHRVRCIQGRGLCQTCWCAPAIRDKFPAKKRFVRGHEPTQLELDAMIEQQMKCLPADFYK